MSRPAPPISFGLACLLMAGCAGDGSEPEPVVQVDSLDGVEHTRVADAPLAQELVHLWSAPNESVLMEGTEWANPTSVAASEDHIAVLDPQISRIHLFSPDGERAGSFGRAGEGPGELANPTSIALHGDSVLVSRSLAHPPLQWFGTDGTLRGTPGGPDAGVSGGAYFLAGSGIVRQVVDLEGADASTAWEFMDLQEQSTRLELPGDHPMQPHVTEGLEGCWRRGTVGPYLAEVDCTHPLVRLTSPTGEVIRVHRIDREPQRTPEALIEQAVDSVEIMMRGSSDGVPSEALAPLIQNQLQSMREEYRWTPVMERVAGSTSGHRILLVEAQPALLGGGPGTLHVLAADGRYLARHRFDGGIRAVAASDTQIVVLVEEPEMGLRRLEAYRLP